MSMNDFVYYLGLVRDFIFKAYSIGVFVIGNGAIFMGCIFLIYKVYQKCQIRKVTKQYAKKIHESQLLQKTFGAMTPEEKEKLKKTGKAESTVKFEFDSLTAT